MALDESRVEVVTFDSFSTLVDVESTAAAIEGYVDDSAAVAREWHERAATLGMVANHLDAYETYYELHRDALAYLLAARDVGVSDDELDEMTAVYYDMAPFGDVRDGMDRLAAAGYELGIVSNGNPSLLESLVDTVDVEGLLSGIVSADEIERYKPASELYEHAADRLGVDPGEVAHVSNGQFDVQGAINAGMQGVWIDRQGLPPEPFGPDPHLTVESIDELTESL